MILTVSMAFSPKFPMYKNSETVCIPSPKYCLYTYIFKFMKQFCFHKFLRTFFKVWNWVSYMILRGHVKESLIPSLVERIGLLFWKNCLFSEGNGLFSRDSWPLASLTYNVLFFDLIMRFFYEAWNI